MCYKVKTSTDSNLLLNFLHEIIAEVFLADNGLYVNNRVGPLRLPSGTFDLSITRTLICRLLDVKKYSLRSARMYRHLEKERYASQNGMHVQKKLKRSPQSTEDPLYDEDGNEKDVAGWVRGSWSVAPVILSRETFNI
ncbi:hypothetical protein EDC94DRAFT_673864 [Helicostylum pulchrum]|nr:hypothetical protein EDC94DRAFT_673864 [Helicostylum pulchrum]